jgi:hypothetical protein
MDYQNGLIGRIADADALLARVAEAIATVRSLDGHVSYVRVAFEEADYAAIPLTATTRSSFSRMAAPTATRSRMTC